YFKLDAQNHTMVVANTPGGHDAAPGPSSVTYKNLVAGETGPYVYDWEKVQELRAGKYTLRDYSFEKPDSNFEASEPIKPQVQAGQVSHSLAVGNNGQLELYDFPGEYAQRFDGIAPGGGD